MDERTRSAVDWLLGSTEPAIRRMTATDVLGQPSPVTDDEVLRGPIVRALLAGQQSDGGFGGHPYKKWTGAHWRLVSLVELEIPQREQRAIRALDTVLAWLTGAGHRSAIREVAGRTRRCASQEGNALAVASRLGVADDLRVQLLARSLVEWQWPDGGWNCDARPRVTTSSVHESLAPAWGLWEYARATGDADAARAARRAGESFLERRIFRSRRTGDVMHPDVVKLHWPPYWHYDVLRALVVLQRMGLVGDPRATDALDLLEERRLEDGRWRAGGVWRSKQGDVVDWGGRGPSEMLTLHALTVLRAAGRL